LFLFDSIFTVVFQEGEAMSSNWVDPNIILGSAATGDNFYFRAEIVDDIWSELKKGNSVLLAAPRRVGKTSVMQYMEQNPVENFKLIFSNIQGIKSSEEFFERIYTLLLNCLNKIDKAKNWFKKFLTSKSIGKIGIDGIEFENRPTDFLKATDALLIEINKISELENIVLLLDELPEVLFKINKTNKNDAGTILEKLRNWRQQPEMNKKVKFVLAGSIGIHYVVDIIGNRNTDINDVGKVDFIPFSSGEARKYIDWAAQGASVIYNAELKEYILSKIQYYVPFFFNLLLDEINKAAKKTGSREITKLNIDTAFDTVVKNNDHFKDWKIRLKKYMPAKHFNFVNEILIHIAHEGRITLQEIYDKAVKHKQTDDYMGFMGNLEKDGYITEIGDEYRFISPFLSAFWKRDNPIY